MLGWRLIEFLAGFPTLAGLSMELRFETIWLETFESSESLDDGTASLSSGTGVGGLNGRAFFEFREDSMGVENCGLRTSSSLTSASSSSSSEDGPSNPANKLLVRNGLLRMSA
jgi:hypothetical protein